MTTKNDVTPYSIRPHEVADLTFVFDSWVKSYWDGLNREPWPTMRHEGKVVGVLSRMINRDHLYTPGQRAFVAYCIAAANVHVAYMNSNPDQLMGFSCGKGNVLHYVYVKSAFRRLGIGLALTRAAVGDGPVVVSHLTGFVERVLRGRTYKHVPNWEK